MEETYMKNNQEYFNKPLAVHGLLSYRYLGSYGWIMIGAKDNNDALREVKRSMLVGMPVLSKLEYFNGEKYIPVII
jgi:hypothetical protein